MKHFHTVGVIGATGNAGKHIIPELLKNGYSVKALTRTPSKLSDYNEQIKIIEGDAREISVIEALVDGCDTIINCVGHTKGEKPYSAIVTKNCISAMAEKNINRYIAITGTTISFKDDEKGFGSQIKDKIITLLFGSIIEDKQKSLDVLASKPLNWTVIRIPLVSEVNSSSAFQTNNTKCLGKRISSQALAAFIIHVLACQSLYSRCPFVWQQ